MSEPTGFLYPYLEEAAEDADRLVEVLVASARAKMAESAELRASTEDRCAPVLEAAGAAMAGRFLTGGRLLTFGNGGSATDAQGAVDLFRDPPWGRPLPAVCLVDDQAVLTALANDVGYDLVFSRQLLADARPEDVACGFSTSGSSANVLAAFTEARRRGLLTVGLSGYDGGPMAASGDVDHCLVVRSQSVHRIQEVQDALLAALWAATQRALEGHGEAA